MSAAAVDDSQINDTITTEDGLHLFPMRKVRCKAYWRFIRLVAPGANPPNTKWSNEDAKEAYCLQCKERMPYVKGSSNSVRRHMAKAHPEEYEGGKTQMQQKHGSSAASGGGNARKRVATSSQDTNSTTHWEAALPLNFKSIITTWLQEDLPSFDIGGFVVGTESREAILWAKSPGIMAGKPFFNAVFDAVECEVEWVLSEGMPTNVINNSKVVAARVYGSAKNILQGERLALNILTRASGIATQAREAVNVARSLGWTGHVAGTRKTTPGFRIVEKYALLVAGASTHRNDLSQMVMLKDNHIWSCGSITLAVQKAKSAAGFSIKIEVECSNKEDAIEAAEAGADIVMLDNFKPEALIVVAQELKEQFPHLLIEASGGITPSTMGSYLSPYVDVISQGRLTQGYPALDFSLKLQPPNSTSVEV